MLQMLFSFLTPIYNDAAEPWQLGFQDGGSPTHEGITALHDSIFFYLVVILFGVMWVLSSAIVNFSSNKSQIVYKYANHGTLIELIWTIIPAFVLILLAFPSFKIIYLIEESNIDPHNDFNLPSSLSGTGRDPAVSSLDDSKRLEGKFDNYKTVKYTRPFRDIEFFLGKYFSFSRSNVPPNSGWYINVLSTTINLVTYGVPSVLGFMASRGLFMAWPIASTGVTLSVYFWSMFGSALLSRSVFPNTILDAIGGHRAMFRYVEGPNAFKAVLGNKFTTTWQEFKVIKRVLDIYFPNISKMVTAPVSIFKFISGGVSTISSMSADIVMRINSIITSPSTRVVSAEILERVARYASVDAQRITESPDSWTYSQILNRELNGIDHYGATSSSSNSWQNLPFDQGGPVSNHFNAVETGSVGYNPISAMYDLITSWNSTPIMESAQANVEHENRFMLHSPLEGSEWGVFDIAQNLAIYSASFFLVIVFTLVVRYVIIRYKEYKFAPVKKNIAPFGRLDFCILFCNVILGISAIGFTSCFNLLFQILIVDPIPV